LIFKLNEEMVDKREFDNPYDDFVPHRENSAFDLKDGKVCT
jgi:hypothetical protein